MATQYLRQCRLTLTNQSEVLDLSELHVQFHVHQALVGVPSWAVIRVFNLSKTTQQIAGQEFDHLRLAVSYDPDNILQIFEGQIRQFNAGRRLNATDTFVDFICADGDYAYNHAVVNRTLAEGSTYREQLDTLLDAFNEKGVGRGYIGKLPEYPLPRSKALFGGARDYMDQLVGTIDADWSIQDGKVILLSPGESLPHEAVELNSATGLIGLPEQAIDGINLRCLINPNIRYGSLLKLNNSDIQAANISVAYEPRDANYIPGIDRDGVYKVYSVSSTGDTRGNDWYSDIVCVGLTADKPLRGPFITAVPG